MVSLLISAIGLLHGQHARTINVDVIPCLASLFTNYCKERRCDLLALRGGRETLEALGLPSCTSATILTTQAVIKRWQSTENQVRNFVAREDRTALHWYPRFS
eukprot:2315529-Amphidinium_carterae.3